MVLQVKLRRLGRPDTPRRSKPDPPEINVQRPPHPPCPPRHQNSPHQPFAQLGSAECRLARSEPRRYSRPSQPPFPPWEHTARPVATSSCSDEIRRADLSTSASIVQRTASHTSNARVPTPFRIRRGIARAGSRSTQNKTHPLLKPYSRNPPLPYEIDF